MLYAVLVWVEALETESYAKGLNATHRLSALRICCAFRTVSNEAPLVIAGIAPLNLSAQENKVVFNQTHGRSQGAGGAPRGQYEQKQGSTP